MMDPDAARASTAPGDVIVTGDDDDRGDPDAGGAPALLADGGTPWSRRVDEKMDRLSSEVEEYDPGTALAAARTAAAVEAGAELSDTAKVAGAIMGVAIDAARSAGVPKEDVVEQVSAAWDDREPDVATDGGVDLPDRCGACGYRPDEWDTTQKNLYGRDVERWSCPRCGSIAEEAVLATDGAGCFWCEGSTSYHPTCDAPGCSRDTHGHGEDGQTVDAYCVRCKGPTATDGGVDTAPEAGCNCEHLDVSATCIWCSMRQPSKGPRLMTDGGTRAPSAREESASDVSPGAFSALISRVDALENRVQQQQETITDLVAMINRTQGQVYDLDDRVDGVVFVDEGGED